MQWSDMVWYDDQLLFGFSALAIATTIASCQILGMNPEKRILENSAFSHFCSLAPRFLRNSGKTLLGPACFLAFKSEGLIYASSPVKGNNGGEEKGSELIICWSFLHFVDLPPGAFEFIRSILAIASLETSVVQGFTRFAAPR